MLRQQVRPGDVRVYHYVMPHQQVRGATTNLNGQRAEVPKQDGHLWVPIDDYTTHVYNWACGIDEDTPLTEEFISGWEAFAGRAPEEHIPGTFRLKRNLSNDFMIDREVQRTHTYTGIQGINTQDFALQEGMGPIVDRSKEFLGTSDRAIVTMRRLILEAIAEVEAGNLPRGFDPATSSNIRAHDEVIPKGADWQEIFGDKLKAYW